MELTVLTSDELNTLRKSDIIFDPNTQKLFEYRNREGKALIVREIGQTKITNILKNTLKNVLKVTGELQSYLLIEIQDNFVTLFNSISGDTFELGFGDQQDNIESIKGEFNKGSEVVAQVFEYEEFKVLIRFDVQSGISTDSSPNEKSSEKVSSKEMEIAKAIEERKAKKRPFGESNGSSKKETKKNATKIEAKKPKKPKKTAKTKKSKK